MKAVKISMLTALLAIFGTVIALNCGDNTDDENDGKDSSDESDDDDNDEDPWDNNDSEALGSCDYRVSGTNMTVCVRFLGEDIAGDACQRVCGELSGDWSNYDCALEGMFAKCIIEVEEDEYTMEIIYPELSDSVVDKYKDECDDEDGKWEEM